MRTVSGFFVAGLLAGVVACGGGSEPSSTSGAPSSPAAAPAGMKVDESKAGSVKGKVVLEGQPPKPDIIKMNADPACLKEAKNDNLSETFVVGDGGAFANVFVYVKDGLGNYVFDTPTQAFVFDQRGCRYRPHVFGIRVGQPIEIVNSDPTLHNIHAVPKQNSEFNTGQPIQGMKTTHTFTAPEVLLPFKCDVHGWMNSYVGVVAHPYFAVTGTDGAFELKALPAGTYTIEAVHEKLGTQTQSVTIGPNEAKDVSFTFKMST